MVFGLARKVRFSPPMLSLFPFATPSWGAPNKSVSGIIRFQTKDNVFFWGVIMPNAYSTHYHIYMFFAFL